MWHPSAAFNKEGRAFASSAALVWIMAEHFVVHSQTWLAESETNQAIVRQACAAVLINVRPSPVCMHCLSCR